MTGKTATFQLIEPTSPEAVLPDHGWWPWLLAAAILAALALAVAVLIRKRRSPAAQPDACQLAFAEAAASLMAITTVSCRDAAVQCSLILRKYLSDTARDTSLFETHEEFVSRHDALQSLTPETRTAVEACFSRLASLKYAPEIPDVPPAGVIADSQSLLESLHQGFAA